jgi:hypothetical protein
MGRALARLDRTARALECELTLLEAHFRLCRQSFGSDMV